MEHRAKHASISHPREPHVASLKLCGFECDGSYGDMGQEPSFLFFFLMIRPPPISTLFPYPALFRSLQRFGEPGTPLCQAASAPPGGGDGGGATLPVASSSAATPLAAIPAAPPKKCKKGFVRKIGRAHV